MGNRKVWYVPPKPGEVCAKPYPEGTPGGYWREYPPKRDIPEAKPQSWEGADREPNDPGKAWKKGGICQPPDRAGVLPVSSIARSETPPTPGARAGLCSECGHICHESGHEIVCSECGLIQEWGELTPEDSISRMFSRFDLLEVSKGLLRPIQQPGGKTPRLFLGTKQAHYYGLSETIECSIADRKRGYINTPGDLPEELSYPALCVLTFYDIPDIEDPPLPVNVNVKDCIIFHEEYKSSELAEINVKINELYGTIYPTTAKTIKKYRDLSINKPGIVPYCHKIYEDTPIGKLLEDHPTAGRAALNGLFNYFMMFFFKHYSLPENAPTRQNIIKSFMNGPKVRGAKYPNKDSAESHFGLLEKYGVINGIEGRENKNHSLYYGTQKSGPHQIPTGPHKSTVEHYILNNKS